MNFSSLRNRKDNTYNYATPVRKLGFEKYVGYYNDISEKEIREITELNEINYADENEEKGILEGIIFS